MLAPLDEFENYGQVSVNAQDYCARWQDKVGMLYTPKGIDEIVPAVLGESQHGLGFAKSVTVEYSKAWSFGKQDDEDDDDLENEEDRPIGMFLGMFPTIVSGAFSQSVYRSYFLPVFLLMDKTVVMYPSGYYFNRFTSDKDSWFWEKFTLVQQWSRCTSSHTCSVGITQFAWKQMYHEVRP